MKHHSIFKKFTAFLLAAILVVPENIVALADIKAPVTEVPGGKTGRKL